MSSARRLVFVVAVLVVATFPMVATGDPPAPRDPKAIEAIIADIETGWETADGALFERHFLDFEGARYIESGWQNKGLRDFIENHVEPEGEALEGLTLTITDVEINFEGHFAWAIADIGFTATVKSDGRKIDSRGYETYLFRYVDGSWKIVHTHSSTRPIKK